MAREEQIREILENHDCTFVEEAIEELSDLMDAELAKTRAATLKEVGEWGSEICTEHYDRILKKGGQPHRCCYECWKSLLKGELPDTGKETCECEVSCNRGDGICSNCLREIK